MRFYDPWQGAAYRDGGPFGLRILIVGESHYDRPERFAPSYTIGTIRELGQGRRFRFHSVVRALVLGTRGWASDVERAAFWDRVAFCNFVQAFPSDRPRVGPTPAMWAAGGPALLQTVAELRPQLVVVLGERIRPWLPPLPEDVRACVVRHPSGSGYRHDVWQPVVREAVLACGGVLPDAEPSYVPSDLNKTNDSSAGID